MAIQTAGGCHRNAPLSCIAIALLFCAISSAAAQQTTTSVPPANDTPEISQKDSATTFKVRVNQVLVRVVVRDSNENVVTGLNREDFVILDGGKPQTITSFTEMKGSEPDPRSTPTQMRNENGESVPLEPGTISSRFIIYLFDDMHLAPGDLTLSRKAADEQIDHSLPWERIAIYTTSGLVRQEYTSDRDILHSVLKRLMPQSLKRETESTCPYMNYYLAHQIKELHDQAAEDAIISDTIRCENFTGMPGAYQLARSEVEAAANKSLSEGRIDEGVLLTNLRAMIRISAGVIGQREIILISPGFFVLDKRDKLTEMLEEALHSSVIIHALDSRGLWTDPVFDASHSSTSQRLQQYVRALESARADIPAEIADTTGGTFFHNRNDLNAGMKLLAGAPEAAYLLSFNPQNLKNDGKFHKISVKLNNHLKYVASTRKGYYAPAKETDPELAANQQLEDTLFSQEELQEIPLDIHTQFFKPTDNSARLSVVARFSLQSLNFRREQDRHSDTLTEVCGIFDRNGQFVAGLRKTIDLHLREATLARLTSGITVRSNLDVKPGSYLVRVVLRDKEGQMISARSLAVEIP